MNPLFVEAIGSIVRAGLNVLATYLVTSGIWSQAEAEKYVFAAAMFLISIGWSVWQKYGMRSKLVTALASSKPMTEKQVTAVVSAGQGASVSTQKHDTPSL